MQKEEQLQREWSKIQTTRKTNTPNNNNPPVQTVPMYQNIDQRRYMPPQKEMRPVQPFYYSNTSPYDYNNYYPEFKREQGFIPNSYPYDNIYPPNPKKYYNYQGEFIYNTQVDSNSLQSMAASINHPVDGKTNYKMISPITQEEEDEELNRLIEKNKKTHILSEVIGQPVSISPQIYASPSPLLNYFSPTYLNPYGGSPIDSKLK